MKSIYYFLCGVMTVITTLMFIIDEYGREFIQDYWISQLWYGDLNNTYDTIRIIILFFDIMLIHHAGVMWASRNNDNNSNDISGTLATV